MCYSAPIRILFFSRFPIVACLVIILNFAFQTSFCPSCIILAALLASIRSLRFHFSLLLLFSRDSLWCKPFCLCFCAQCSIYILFKISYSGPSGDNTKFCCLDFFLPFVYYFSCLDSFQIPSPRFHFSLILLFSRASLLRKPFCCFLCTMRYIFLRHLSVSIQFCTLKVMPQPYSSVSKHKWTCFFPCFWRNFCPYHFWAWVISQICCLLAKKKQEKIHFYQTQHWEQIILVQ